jgi:hypothetical protein
LQQLPRREYSDAAIASRKELLQVAYQVLSNPIRRAEYDATFLAPAVESNDDSEGETPPNLVHFPIARLPELEVAPEHFLGALLILFEQGEYEEINAICFPYIGNNGNSNNSGSLIPSDFNFTFNTEDGSEHEQLATEYLDAIESDVTLTFVLSVLEMGKSEWKSNNYEAAARHLEMALKILTQGDLFTPLQSEIARDLDKLRPYRVLHLVSLSDDQIELRQTGLNLLTEMLSVCSVNDIACKERFGLRGEGTLKFIDRVRGYLTAAEQQHLFSQISGNSQQLVCTYLYVYALIARGFAYRNPQLISTARQILLHRLSQRRDVHIEEAICALLLGQTDEVNQILESLPESEFTIVIRQRSQGAPDLLPGLCWYIEHEWLPQEVWPYFRDLSNNHISLDTYFQDPYVQTVLEHPATQTGLGSWMKHKPELIDVPISGDLSPIESSNLSTLPSSDGTPSSSLGGLDLLQAWQSPDRSRSDLNIPIAQRVMPVEAVTPSEIIPELLASNQTDEAEGKVIHLERERARRRQHSAPTANSMFNSGDAPLADGSNSSLVTIDRGRSHVSTDRAGKLARRRRRKLSVNVPRLLLVSAGGIACSWAGLFMAQTAWNTIQTNVNSNANLKPRTQKSPAPHASKPPSPQPSASLPSATTPPAVVVGLLTTATAKQIVETWLSTKTQSLGKEYQADKLAEILVEPALSRYRDRVQTEKTAQGHWVYRHDQIEIESVNHRDPQTNSAFLIAKVEENAEYYQNEQLKTDQSYKKNLRVKYDLRRQADRWYIKSMTVIN